MNHQFDVVVVGGGIVGLTAALAMAKRDFTVAVIDGTSLIIDSNRFDPRVYAINLASQELFEQLNVWQQIKQERLSPYHRMHVWDAANRAHIDFDSREVKASALGHILEETVLKEALLKEIGHWQKVHLFADSKIERIEQANDRITVSAANSSWEAKLLMIADGANSLCRKLLNVGLTSWSYHQDAIVALVKTEQSHQKTAYQVFNSDGPLAFLPLADEHLCSIVWSTTPAHAKKLMAFSAEDFNHELEKAFASKLGKVEVQGARYGFPLTMRHAKQYSGQNWILMGDAAHTIHPLAGLGLNVGLADVDCWLQALDGSSNRINLKLLGFYQRQRRYAVWQIIAMMEGLKAVFLNPLRVVSRLRAFGLSFCNRLPPLKKLFIQQAAGKSLEL
ncbi:FAD-dependent oxidoreductase [Legionella jordanis]|uniref:FAD-dependent monooxygenase n=1 Tax=Legionella jordanis TaxID=456 RepID=UPI000EFDCB4A|nr:FAD-dependent monooxygenase [Legionella jordanis]RMX21757.1 FAD-dependent oxidoreductase [Legionella jordanis]